jgi:hypothetical protein
MDGRQPARNTSSPRISDGLIRRAVASELDPAAAVAGPSKVDRWSSGQDLPKVIKFREQQVPRQIPWSGPSVNSVPSGVRLCLPCLLQIVDDMTPDRPVVAATGPFPVPSPALGTR